MAHRIHGRSRLHDLRWWTAGRKGGDPYADAVVFTVEYSVRSAPIAVKGDHVYVETYKPGNSPRLPPQRDSNRSELYTGVDRLRAMKDQEVLVRNLFMSVDPYMRGRMNEGKSYVPPFELGKPLNGGAIGDVIESRAREFKPGDVVSSNFG